MNRVKKGMLAALVCLAALTVGLIGYDVAVNDAATLLAGRERLLAMFSPSAALVQEAKQNIQATAVAAGPTYLSPASMASDGTYLYIADATAGQVYKVRQSDGRKMATYSAGDQVNGVVFHDNHLYVLYGELDGKVQKLTTDLKTSGSPVSVGHTPVAAAVGKSKLYVANRFSNTVSVLSLSSMQKVKEVPVTREPCSLAAVGDYVFSAGLLPEGPSNGEVVSAKVSVIRQSDDTVTKTIPLLNGSMSVRDMVASPDGKYLYLSHLLARYAHPLTQLDRGWANTNAVTILDVAKQSVLTAVLLDDVELGAGNPWGLGVSQDGSHLVVAISGTHEAMVIDTEAMFNRIAEVQAGEDRDVARLEDIPNYLPFLKDYKTRISLTGNGPRELVVSGDKAYIGQYFSGDIAVLDLEDYAVSTFQLGVQPRETPVRRGEALWFDATYGYQQWQSCASCHVDGRVDGLNWDSTNDGIGNPKNTKSVLYTHRTPPSMATGIVASGEEAVRASTKFTHLNTIPEADNLAIDAYLKSLRPVASPYLNKDGTLTESAARGKELFTQAGCVTCHSGPHFTDLKTHDVGTLDGTTWEHRPLDTPSLVEVWRTGPWLHNGSQTDMAKLIKTYFLKGKSYNDAQVQDLANYVLSIGAENELYGVERVLVVDQNHSDKLMKFAPGDTLTTITVRKQAETAFPAKVVLELLDGDGKSLKRFDQVLPSMGLGETVDVAVNLTIPDKTASYRISILNADKTSWKLATDLVVTAE